MALRRRVIRRDLAALRRMPSRVLGELLPDYRCIDFPAYASAVQCKCLLISGDRDRLSPVMSIMAFARSFHDDQVQIIPGANHLLQLEQPTVIAGYVHDFIRGV